VLGEPSHHGIGDLGFSASDPGHLVRKDNFTWIGLPPLAASGGRCIAKFVAPVGNQNIIFTEIG